jgi:hypothetical protein
METTHGPLHLDKWSLVGSTAQDHGHTSFILIIILFDEALNYVDGAKFWGYIETNTV